MAKYLVGIGTAIVLLTISLVAHIRQGWLCSFFFLRSKVTHGVTYSLSSKQFYQKHKDDVDRRDVFLRSRRSGQWPFDFAQGKRVALRSLACAKAGGAPLT
jgi:hypothetical protein